MSEKCEMKHIQTYSCNSSKSLISYYFFDYFVILLFNFKMQATLFVITLTVLVTTAYSSPFNVGDTNINVQEIISQEVPKNKVTELISEIIGMDIVDFSDQTKIAALELLQIISTANGRFQNISGEASPEFQVEIGQIILKTIGRFTNLYERVVSAVQSFPENSSMLIVQTSANKAVKSLRELAESGADVSKEAVSKIIDEFLATSFTSTVWEEIRYSKVIVEIVFIIDEANVAVSSVIANEKPEVAEKIQVLTTEIQNSVMTAIRPLVELVKPLILPNV